MILEGGGMLVKRKKMSEGEKGVLLAAGIIFLIFYFPGIWFLHESRILPYSQRWFISYTIFYKNAASVPVPYPPNLPSGAGSIKYYYYQGWFDTKSAVSFTVSNEEYQETRETYLSFYKIEEDNDRGSWQEDMEENGKITDRAEKRESDYVFDKKLTSDFLEEEGLEFLRKVFHDSAEHYTILAYKGDAEGGELCNLEGVFCNDETNEVVMFGFRDAFRQSRQ